MLRRPSLAGFDIADDAVAADGIATKSQFVFGRRDAD